MGSWKSGENHSWMNVHCRGVQGLERITIDSQAVRIHRDQRQADAEDQCQPLEARRGPGPLSCANRRLKRFAKQEKRQEGQTDRVSGMEIDPQQHQRSGPPQ